MEELKYSKILKLNAQKMPQSTKTVLSAPKKYKEEFNFEKEVFQEKVVLEKRANTVKQDANVLRLLTKNDLTFNKGGKGFEISNFNPDPEGLSKVKNKIVSRHSNTDLVLRNSKQFREDFDVSEKETETRNNFKAQSNIESQDIKDFNDHLSKNLKELQNFPQIEEEKLSNMKINLATKGVTFKSKVLN